MCGLLFLFPLFTLRDNDTMKIGSRESTKLIGQSFVPRFVGRRCMSDPELRFVIARLLVLSRDAGEKEKRL